MPATTQISTAMDFLLARLDVLRNAGVLCRRPASQPSQAGIEQRNGVITLYWAGDIVAKTKRSPGLVEQMYNSRFVFQGRLRNLRDDSGIYYVRDILMQQTLGVTLPGYRQETSAVSFLPEVRTDKAWPFMYTLEAPGLNVFSNCDELEPDALAGSGAIAEELIFLGEVRDRFGSSATFTTEGQ